MRKSWLRVLGVTTAVILTVVIGALSQVPYEPDRRDDAVIRLAWRVRGTRVEECRRLTEEELARKPAHMRQEVECDGRILPYRLLVSIDDSTVVDRVVRPAGAREDRPLYVFHEQTVLPGEREVTVRFELEREAEPRTASDTTRASTADDTPSVLELNVRLALGPKEVALVTYDGEQRQLVVKGYGTP